MGIVVLGAVFVDIKGYPEAAFIPTGRNVGRVEQIHGGVGRNVAEDVANCELRPTFIGLVDESGKQLVSRMYRSCIFSVCVSGFTGRNRCTARKNDKNLGMLPARL